MRTKTLLLIAAAVAAGAVATQAQVYSVNAVGYVNKPLVKGFNLVSNPLIAQTNTISALFSGQVPTGTTVFLWDTTNKKYIPGSYDTDFGWDPQAVADTQLMPGTGLFVKVPAAATVTFVGEVPQNATAALKTPLIAGLQIVSSQVPQAGKITTDLNYQAADNDKVFQWDSTAQTYKPFSFSTDFGWDPSEPVLDVGEAVFLSRVAAGSWDRNFSVNQ